jgi:hypothetical protein
MRYNLKTDRNKQLSAHFKVREFASKCGADEVLIDPRLVQVLQHMRDDLCRPININSGFRTPAHNARVGGSATSQHLLGTAADIRVVGVSTADLCKAAENALAKFGIAGGIILYHSFVHVDVRANRYRARNNNGRVTNVPGWAKAAKSVDDVAREIAAGRGNWGNGEDRRRRLAAAGHDPAIIQRRVNELLR